jgi:ubiquinone/menaquinone biosynthesis C-methylase UbiE
MLQSIGVDLKLVRRFQRLAVRRPPISGGLFFPECINMGSATFKGLKLAQGLGDALLAVHGTTIASAPSEQANTIKEKIAACYDYHAAYGVDVFWNWGMFDDALHRESPRRVLEVGCGSGKGLNLLSRLESKSTFVGLDLSEQAVRQAKARFSRPGALDYVQGDAERLPFDDGEFDAVINVESSHNYPNLRGFLLEVARVLRPGGYFSHVDAFTDGRYAMMRQCKESTSEHLRWLEEHDISDRVREAVRRRMVPGSVFRNRLKRSLPWHARLVIGTITLRGYGSAFAAAKGPSGDSSSALLPGTWSGRWRLPALMRTYRHTLGAKPAV